MKATTSEDYNSKSWSLQNKGESYLFYLKGTKSVEVDLSNFQGNYDVFWVNLSSGDVISKTMIKGNTTQTLLAPSVQAKAVFIKKK
jgi:hypothetical protein